MSEWHSDAGCISARGFHCLCGEIHKGPHAFATLIRHYAALGRRTGLRKQRAALMRRALPVRSGAQKQSAK